MHYLYFDPSTPNVFGAVSPTYVEYSIQNYTTLQISEIPTNRFQQIINKIKKEKKKQFLVVFSFNLHLRIVVKWRMLLCHQKPLICSFLNNIIIL